MKKQVVALAQGYGTSAPVSGTGIWGGFMKLGAHFEVGASTELLLRNNALVEP